MTQQLEAPTEDAPVDFGYDARVLRARPFSFRVHLRIAGISALLFTLAILLGLLAMRYGEYPLTLEEVVAAFLGREVEGPASMIVLEWRAPIVVAALVFGALLAMGGAIFQSLTRNPLGSPDIIGFDAGSYTAVVVTIILLGNRSYWTIASGSLIGGLLTAFVVYVLAYRRGIQGFRLIIVGIGVTAILGSLNSYLITRADLEDAMTVGFWGAGSLSRVTWASMVPSLMVALVIVLACTLLAGPLRRLELGDDTAVTHGTRVGLVRLLLIVVGVATTALVTAAAGPIGFIALVAPQIARRLTRSAGVSVLASAAMGSALLTGAHLASLVIAQAYRPIPVGLITVCVGGTYLIWLLVREARKHYGVPV